MTVGRWQPSPGLAGY